jgi:hypothetical protein
VDAVVGVELPFPDGKHFDRGAHRQWVLPYARFNKLWGLTN